MRLTSTARYKTNHSLHREAEIRDTRDKSTAVLHRITLAVFAALLPCVVVLMPATAEGSTAGKGQAPATQANSPNPPTVQPAGDLVVSEERGLLSLTAVSVELPQLLAALSRASGVPIELVDQVRVHDKLTISFHRKTVQEAIVEVTSALPAGSFASAGNFAGGKQTIYVISKEGAANFRRNAQEMIDRIQTGDSPTPSEITAWLPTVAEVGFSLDPDGTSTFIVPVLQFLDAHYDAYGASVESLFRDASVVGPLRSAMLELIGRHRTHPGTRTSLLV